MIGYLITLKFSISLLKNFWIFLAQNTVILLKQCIIEYLKGQKFTRMKPPALVMLSKKVLKVALYKLKISSVNI